MIPKPNESVKEGLSGGRREDRSPVRGDRPELRREVVPVRRARAVERRRPDREAGDDRDDRRNHDFHRQFDAPADPHPDDGDDHEQKQRVKRHRFGPLR